MTERLDLEGAWARLGPEGQRQIGMATIAEYVALLAESAPPPHNDVLWDNILDHAETAIVDLLEQAGVIGPADGLCADDFDLPDLNQLGIRMCTRCGCTDDHGCEEGCTWVGPTTCSTCAPS